MSSLLRQKNEDFFIFKKFKTVVENQTNGKIKKLGTDDGFEFYETDFNKFFPKTVFI